MKSLLLVTLFAALAGTALADDVALLRLRFANQKTEARVAIELFEADAPATVANFKKLIRKGFYKGCAFHRAFPGTLVQIGDPYSRGKERGKVGTGGPGYTVVPEIRRRHPAGTVSMARLPDKLNPARVSNGSQFFVCLTDLPSYDGQYTAFGRVLYGMEALTAISNLPVDTNDYPTERVYVREARLVPRERLPAAPTTPGPTPMKRPWWRIF